MKNNCIRYAVMLYYCINNRFSKVESINENIYWLIIDNVSDLINDNENWIKGLTFSVGRNWEIGDKVYGQVFWLIY